jgi:hypothetical protein
MWATLLQETFGDGNSIYAPLGSWLMDNNHQNNEWWLDPHSRSIYQYTIHTWIRYTATNYGRLRFHTAGTYTPPPNSPSHMVEISKPPRYLEITVKTQIVSREEEHSDRLHEYTSEVSPDFFEIPQHSGQVFHVLPNGWCKRTAVHKTGEHVAPTGRAPAIITTVCPHFASTLANPCTDCRPCTVLQFVPCENCLVVCIRRGETVD